MAVSSEGKVGQITLNTAIDFFILYSWFSFRSTVHTDAEVLSKFQNKSITLIKRESRFDYVTCVQSRTQSLTVMIYSLFWGKHKVC